MVHPDTTLKFVNPTIGSGVFATKFIPKGTLTYVKDSLEIDISPDQYKIHSAEMRKIIDKYSFIDEAGHYIVSWDNAKYINHSCEPNSISTGYGFEIAIKDIHPGDEITDDYGLFNLEQSFECGCGSSNCRKKIHPDDLENFHSFWDEKILNALAAFKKVEQPILPFLDDKTKSDLNKFLKDSSPYISCLNLRHSSYFVKA